MHLNVGCGNDVRQGYVNVDFRQTHPAVMKVDLSVLPWPFADESADEILMLDFLEHFPYRRTKDILGECRRILKFGGTVDIQVPDFGILSSAIHWRGRFPCNSCGIEINPLKDSRCPGCKRRREIQDAAVSRLYGGQDYEGNFHQTAFTWERLIELCAEHGLNGSVMLENDHQKANWNFKQRFTRTV